MANLLILHMLDTSQQGCDDCQSATRCQMCRRRWYCLEYILLLRLGGHPQRAHPLLATSAASSGSLYPSDPAASCLVVEDLAVSISSGP